MSYVRSNSPQPNYNRAGLPVRIPAPDVVAAAGEIGKHFIGKLSGLGDYFRVLDIAGPVVSRRMQGLGAISLTNRLVQSQLAQQLATASPYPNVQPQAPRVPLVNVATAVPAPAPIPVIRQITPPPPTVADRPVAYPQPFISDGYGGAPSGPATLPYYGSGGNGGSPPVEVGTLPSGGGMQMAGMFGSMNPMMLLALAGVGFFLMNQKKGR